MFPRGESLKRVLLDLEVFGDFGIGWETKNGRFFRNSNFLLPFFFLISDLYFPARKEFDGGEIGEKGFLRKKIVEFDRPC